MNLARRIGQAFSGDLETPSGRVAQLLAISILLGLMEKGRLNTFYRRALKQMARPLLAR